MSHILFDSILFSLYFEVDCNSVILFDNLLSGFFSMMLDFSKEFLLVRA